MKTIFLDRDGVINKDSAEYIKSWDEYFFIPGSLQAMALLKENGYQIMLITNQSVINRKMVALETLSDMHDRIKQAAMDAGGFIEDIFFCPHTPSDRCECRKPAPGMILSACKKHGLEVSETIMVGDSEKDMEAARNAGCAKCILVRTGNGRTTEASLEAKNRQADHVADDLMEAVRHIIKEKR